MENSRTHWNNQAGKSTSRLKYVENQCFFTSQYTGSMEVETARSMDDLMTSQSITGRRDFSDCDKLGAMIVSALGKLLTTVHFRKVSVEEQRAQKYDRFLRGRQIANMIYEHFRATGAYEAVQGLPDLFNIRLQNDDVQDFDTRWTKPY